MASPYANWSANAYYKIGDIVQYPVGSFFQAILANIGVPPSASSPWSAYSPVTLESVTALNGKTGALSIVAGTNVTIDTRVPSEIKINAGGGSGGVVRVNPGDYILVDNTNQSQPIVSVIAGDGLVGSADDVPSLTVLAGSGINVSKDGGVSVNAGVGLTISEGALAVDYGNGLTISENKLQNSGIISLTAGTGINSTGGQNPTITNNGIISLTAGEGISSTGGKNPTITNDGILSITTGSFLTYTDGQNPFITALVAQNSGLVIDTTDPEKPNLYLKHGEGLDVDVDSEFIGTLVNSGVITLTAGTGITSTGGKNPTIANSGVLDLTAGTGITSTGGQNPTIGNSGVLDLTAGTGITSTGGQNPTIGNSGIITLDVGSGITSTGGQYPTIANSGVLDLTAGTGITITGSKTNYTISAPSVSPTIYTATYWIYTSQNIAGGQPYNTNLRFERETYSTPESMSLASQGAGTGSFSNWICPISGVWSISITMNTLSGTAGVPQGQLVMLQYNNPNEYTPRIVTASEALTFCSSSVTATALLTQGSAYVISSPPAFASYVYVVPKSSWTLTYLGPSP